MAKFICKYCNWESATYKTKGPHIGEWCSFCNRWIRWVPKSEMNEHNCIKTETENKFITNTLSINTDDTFDEEVPWY